MSHSKPHTSRQAGVSTPNKAKKVRLSNKREHRLKQYIHGLLPSHLNKKVDVVITPHVETACVLPATEEELISSDQTEFDRKQARQHIESVDGDFLVLITGKQTPTDSIPLDDQLTVDAVYQFGLALHETLHILKTSFSPVTDLVKSEVEDQYQEYVQELINITEDGAIENEAITGDVFSDKSSTRLKVVNEVLAQKPEDFKHLPQQNRTFTLGDAIHKGLYERLIYDSELTDTLTNESNDLIEFESEDAKQAFSKISPKIDQLATEIKTTRGDNCDNKFRNDREASLKRAKITIRFWKNVIKPIFTPDESQDRSSQNQPDDQAGSGQPQASGDNQQPNADQTDSDTAQNESGQSANQGPETQQNATKDGSNGDSIDSPKDPSQCEIDPSNITVDLESVESNEQNAEERPQIGDSPDPDDVELEQDNAPKSENPDSEHEEGEEDNSQNSDSADTTEEDPTETANECPSGGDDNESNPKPDSPAPDTDNTDNNANQETGSDSGIEEDQDGETEQEGEMTVETDTDTPTKPPDRTELDTEPDSGQSTFGDFGNQDDPTEGDSGNEDSEIENSTEQTGEGDTPKDDDEKSQDKTDTETDSGTDRGTGSEFGDTESDSEPQQESESETHGGQQQDSSPESASSNQSEEAQQQNGEQANDSNKSESSPEPVHNNEDIEPDEFGSDRRQAHQTANEETIDENSLQRDLKGLERSVDNKSDGPSIEELSVLPIPLNRNLIDTDWDDIEQSAETVATTLENVLRIDQITQKRKGMTSGTTVDTKSAHRLSYNDPRVFEQSIPGKEKEYFIVIILDRSSSMRKSGRCRNSKMHVASQAVARFSTACENLGIEVAIIDFYDEESRLIKPPSVKTEYAQESILNTETAGCTPLSDSLKLAQDLAEKDTKESLIISMTDGKPSNIEDTITEIRKSYTPICSLTIATNREKGNPPAKAKELENEFLETETVYEPEMIDKKLDDFAALLGMI